LARDRTENRYPLFLIARRASIRIKRPFEGRFAATLIVWGTVRDGEIVSYRDEPETGFRRRFVADLVKLLPIDSQV
jgi:hypothetical protein